VSLADSLEAAAEALPAVADSIRDANGDPNQLLATLDADAAVEVLVWMLTNEAEAAEELASSWVEDERGTAPLLQVQDKGLPKAGRKVLRRALHRLRSRGIEAPAEPRKQEHVARLPDVQDDLGAAYATGLDPRGSRLVFVVESNPSGGARLFEALIDDIGGVVDFQVYSAGRSRVREFVKEATRRSGPQAVATEPEAAKLLIARAAAVHPADRALPRAFAEWRTHLAPADGAKTPGEAFASQADSGEPTLAQHSRVRQMIEDGSLGPWPPDRELLKQVADAAAAETESELVVSEATREARIDALVDDALKTLFDATHTERTAARFEESAYVLSTSGQEEDASACLAVAGELRAGGAEPNAAARAMVQVLLAPLLESLRAEAGKQEEGEDSLVVEP
jgi:hypothetical protein